MALPEDALGLVPVERQDLLGEPGLHPGQLPVRVPLLLHGDDVLQGAAEHGRVEDGVLGVADLLDVRLLQALRETPEVTGGLRGGPVAGTGSYSIPPPPQLSSMGMVMEPWMDSEVVPPSTIHPPS